MKKFLYVICLIVLLIFWTGCSRVDQLKEAYQNGDLEKVLEIAKELGEEQPHNPDLHFYIGQAYENLGKFREALKEYELVLILRPHYDSKYGNKEEVQERINKLQEQLAHEEKQRTEQEQLDAFKRIKEIPVEKANAKELGQAYIEALSHKMDTTILLEGIYDMAGIGEVSLAYNLYERFKDSAEGIEEVISPRSKPYFAEAKVSIPQIQAQKIGSGTSREGRITLHYLSNDSGLLYILNTGQNSNNIYLYYFDFQTMKNEEILRGTWTQEEAQFQTLPDGRILYSDKSKIIILNKENFSVEKEVTLPEDVTSLDVHCEGRKVAFTKVDSGLWVSGLDFQEPKLVLASVVEDNHTKEPGMPRWNPKGTKIAYVEYCRKSTSGVGVINEDGSNKVFKELSDVYNPVWFLDGQKIEISTIAYGAETGKSWIWNVVENSIKQINDKKHVNNLGISHNGSKASYLNFCGIGYNLWIKDMVTEKESLIGGNIGVVDYDWSPDDKRVIFAVKTGKEKPLTFWISQLQ